jgi:membrane protease YdiL (CAAX protease family)
MLGPFPSAYDPFMPAVDPDARRRLWIEVALVLSLAVAPDFVSALMSYLAGTAYWEGEYPPLEVAFYVAHRAAMIVVPLLCVMALVGQPASSIGLWRIRSGDVAAAVLLIVVTYVAAWVCAWPLSLVLGVTPVVSTGNPGDGLEWALYAGGEVANALAEELAIWGFLYVRLRQLWHRAEWPAIAASAAAFASYHVYQGLDGAAMIFVMGVVHGTFFRVTRRLWPLVIAHAATNVILTLLD